MKDEQFTMTPEMPAMSPELLARWQEDMRRNALRMKHFSEMVMNPKEPEVGSIGNVGGVRVDHVDLRAGEDIRKVLGRFACAAPGGGKRCGMGHRAKRPHREGGGGQAHDHETSDKHSPS